MSKPPDLKLIRRLLPALRRMVLMPGRPVSTISTELSVELSDLHAWLKVHGKPTAAQVEKLEDSLNGDTPAPVSETIGRVESRSMFAPRTAPATLPAKSHSAPNNGASRPALVKPAAPPISGKLEAPTADIGRWLEQQRAEITGRVNCFQVRVTPAMADLWMAFNHGNRKPSKAKVRRFAAAMEAGRWTLNGETVKFSASGRLIDGQSRLMAIGLAKVSVVLEVRAGLPDVAQQSMDSGEMRKGAHMLEMLGEANPTTLAAARKIVWVWRKGWLGGYAFGVSRVMENGEVGELLAECPALKASAGWVISDGHKINRLMPRSDGAFFHWLFGLVDGEVRDQFFEALCEGVGLTKLSPIYHLREQLLADRGGTDTEPRKVLRRAIVIKAWNAAHAGEKVSKLAWREGEHFPDVAGLDTPEKQKLPEKIRGKGGAE